MANPYDQFRVTPPSPPALPDNPYAQYGSVRAPSAKPAERSTWDMIDNYVRQFASGASLFTADELAAAGDVLLNRSFAPDTVGGYAESIPYADLLKMHRDRDKAFVKDYPVTSAVAQGAGALAMLPAAIPKALWSGAKTLGRTMFKSAAGGAALGGAAGFGQGEGSFEDRLKSAGWGAAIGGGAGAALPPLLGTAGWAAKNAGGRWVQENVGAPVLDKLADITAYFTPKTKPGNLSAAAPDGGPGVPVAGTMDNITEALRGKASAMANPAETDALKTIARTMAAGGRSTDDIARELTLMGPEATLANASPIQTQNLLRTAYMSPGSAMQTIKDALDAQARGTGPRMVRAFEGAEPPPTVYDAARFLQGPPQGAPGPRFPGYISTEGERIYTPLRTGNVPVISPEMQAMLDNNPAVRAAYDAVKTNAADYGRTLTPFDILHRVKRQLNLDADAAITNGRAVNKADVAATADEWERLLYAANPGIQAADQAYSRVAGLPEWMERGRNFMRGGVNEMADSVSPSALAAEFPMATEAEKLLFRVGSTNTVRDAALTGDTAARRLATNIDKSDPLREKLTTIYGPDQGQSIVRQAGTERAFGEMKNRVMVNSQTAAVLSDMADQGVPTVLKPGGGSLTSRAWDAVMDAGRKLANNNEAVRDAYTRVLLETNPTQNLKNLEILDALIRAQLEGSVGRAGTAAVSGGQGGDMLRVKR